MRRTPWKLLAGGLVLSVGGLAAVGGVPLRAGQVACSAQPPEAVPLIPALPPVAQPLPVPPTVSDPTAGAPATVLTPTPPPPMPTARATETAPVPRPKSAAVVDLSIPPTRSVAPPYDPPPVAAPTTPDATPEAVPASAERVTQLQSPLVSTPATPLPAPVAQPVPATLQQVAPLPAADVVEKKLKVMLHMGDDRPRFEIRDGEECYLKVVCDRVDVKSPSDRGESMSVMKATGKVAFVTPGGEGECEELSVVPGTGQVIVSGKVTVKHTWGKSETTFSGDRMTFRLGSVPGTVPVGPTAVPASFRRP